MVAFITDALMPATKEKDPVYTSTIQTIFTLAFGRIILSLMAIISSRMGRASKVQSKMESKASVGTVTPMETSTMASGETMSRAVQAE